MWRPQPPRWAPPKLLHQTAALGIQSLGVAFVERRPLAWGQLLARCQCQPHLRPRHHRRPAVTGSAQVLKSKSAQVLFFRAFLNYLSFPCLPQGHNASLSGNRPFQPRFANPILMSWYESTIMYMSIRLLDTYSTSLPTIYVMRNISIDFSRHISQSSNQSSTGTRYSGASGRIRGWAGGGS